jgi:hypothetical protein
MQLRLRLFRKNPDFQEKYLRGQEGVFIVFAGFLGGFWEKWWVRRGFLMVIVWWIRGENVVV